MNPIITRFKSHAVHNALEEFHKACAEWTLPREKEGERPHLARFYRVFRKLEFLIKQSDPLLWSPTALTTAENAIRQMTQALEQFKGSNNIGQLRNGGDAAIDSFHQLSWLSVRHDQVEQRNAFSGLIEDAEETIATLGEQQEAQSTINEQIEAAKNEFQESLNAFGTSLSDFETQFEAQKTRVDELVSDHQTKFQSSQQDRSNAFSTEQSTRESQMDDWLEQAQARLDETITTLRTDVKVVLTEMGEHRDRAQEILGLVAASGVSGHYNNTAKRELMSAEVLRVLALACFGVMGWMVFHVVESLTEPSFRWEMGLFRVGVGLAMLVPAFYCARESAKHREAGNRNRRLQIELATIEPYLEKIHDDAQMRAILKEKANSYFLGQTVSEPSDESEEGISPKELRRREDQLMEIIKALGGALKR